MKSISLSYSDVMGGAAIAAHRTHLALLQQGVDSHMWVDRKNSDDWTVRSGVGGIQGKLSRLRPFIGNELPARLFKTSDAEKRSFNCLPSPWVKQLNKSDADIVHLHWCHNEVLSINDFARIRKPVVQTIHDMWPFCGSEHYSFDTRWIDGYDKTSRGSSVSGADIDRWTWQRKQRAWKQPWQLVAVSNWLAGCVQKSSLLADWPVAVIPNPIDTNIWKPLDKSFARNALGLNPEARIITFGAVGGIKNPRKGYTLLLEALQKLKQTQAQNQSVIQLIVYGQGKPQHIPDMPFEIIFMGKMHDPTSMNLLNNAADCFVNAAIQETFGQTGSEAQASGLPAVGFLDTGMVDVLEHKVTGYLAKHADSDDLANGIRYVLDNNTIARHEGSTQTPSLSANARQRAVRLFSYEAVAEQYINLYQTVIEQNQ